MTHRVYLVGSLRNPLVTRIAAQLRTLGLDAFDDWHAAGEHADDAWRDYEIGKGHSFIEALAGVAAQNVFDFDYRNIFMADAVILLLPAGKSGHLEFGYCVHANKPAVILLEDSDAERFDVMYLFAGKVTRSVEDAASFIKQQMALSPSMRVEAVRQRRIEQMVKQFYAEDRAGSFISDGTAKTIEALQTRALNAETASDVYIEGLASIAHSSAQDGQDAMRMRNIATRLINPKKG